MNWKKRMSSESTDKEMSFFDHLEEMRGVIMKCAIVIFLSSITVGFLFYYSISIFDLSAILKYPLDVANKALADEGIRQIETRVTTMFSPYFIIAYVAIFGGIFFALPLISYFIIKFVMPALTRSEKRILIPTLGTGFILFTSGVLLSFFFVAPTAVKFSAVIAQDLNLGEHLWDIGGYYSTLMWITLAMGLSFELPLIQVVLMYLGVLKAEWLRKNRAISVLVIFVFAAVVTPPDVVSQIALGVPLYLLYEVAIIVGSVLVKKKEAREAKERAREEEEDRLTRKQLAAQRAKAKQDSANDDSDSSNNGSSDDGSVTEHFDYNEYGLTEDDPYADMMEPYMDYDYQSKPVPDFSPNWKLNVPDFSPKFDLNAKSEDEQ